MKLWALLGLVSAEQPNVVYLMIDDWGWGDFGVHGSRLGQFKILIFSFKNSNFHFVFHIDKNMNLDHKHQTWIDCRGLA